MTYELDFLEEMKGESQAKLAINQRKMDRDYNSKSKRKSICLNDLVLRRVFLSLKEPRARTLGPNWKGPYHIKEEIRLGTYKIEGMDGMAQPHPWNVEHL